MRTVGLCVCAFLCFSLSSAQVPNGGFENWVTDPDSNTNPVGWQTTNSYPAITVEPYAPGCRGELAMKVKTLNLGFPLPGVAILETAIHLDRIPEKFSACVKSNIMPGDQAFIIIALMRGDSVIAAADSCTFKIDSSYSEFTFLEFPLVLQSALVPDSLLIMVASGLAFGQEGTELIVDEMTFTAAGSTTVLESGVPPDSPVLHPNYPNPFNPTTTIRYSLPRASEVSLSVYDGLGRIVAPLVREREEAGDHEVTFDGRGLPSGVYFIRLRIGDAVRTNRLVLLR